MRNRMDETPQDEIGSKSIASEDVRWVFNKRSKLWVPQHKKQKWFRRWKTSGGKLPFDWLNLIGVLAIPFVVTFLGLYATQQITQQQAQFTQQQHQTDLQIATDQQQDTTLKTYLDDISDLLFNHNLSKSKPGDAVSEVARERTLTTLRRLNADHNRIILQFLQDAHLIGGHNAVIDFIYADLSGVDLRGANLSGANLRGANLSGADLSDADLSYTDLSYADLNGANLRLAGLSDADLSDANLFHANLNGALLSGANLFHAYLSDANLSYANLNGANLSEAILSDAHLSGATMPDGSKHP